MMVYIQSYKRWNDFISSKVCQGLIVIDKPLSTLDKLLFSPFITLFKVL